MSDRKAIADIRREYGDLGLDENIIQADPITQFQLWFSDILKTETSDPTAMVLSTVDEKGRPDSRVVLLKGIEENQFLFYTNYQSIKSQQLETNPCVALLFYWPSLSRQVRIRGRVQLLSAQLSDEYFSSRPILSQWSAIVSPQSAVIKSREELEQAFQRLQEKNDSPIRPNHWGGYGVIPYEVEFWQGRDNRLHDRIQYIYQHNHWSHQRLAP